MNPQPVSEQEIQPHSIWQSIILHLFPSVLLLVFFVMAVPFVDRLGLPLRFAAMLGVFLVLIPFELGVSFSMRERNGMAGSRCEGSLFIEKGSLCGNISSGFPCLSFGPVFGLYYYPHSGTSLVKWCSPGYPPGFYIRTTV